MALHWIVNEEYSNYVTADANVTFCKISNYWNRRFVKINPGLAIVAAAKFGEWMAPLLISTDRNAVYYTAAGDGPFGVDGSFEYMDTIWYWGSGSHNIQTNDIDMYEGFPYLGTFDGDRAAVALDVVKKVVSDLAFDVHVTKGNAPALSFYSKPAIFKPDSANGKFVNWTYDHTVYSEDTLNRLKNLNLREPSVTLPWIREESFTLQGHYEYDRNYLKDTDFLNALSNEHLQTHYVKIEVLDMAERPLSAIQGRVTPGSSMTLDASSGMRRTCSINFLAEETDNDLTNVDNLLSLNKRVKVFEGIENTINPKYPEICWIPLGIYVITDPSISHTLSGVNIALTLKDKMCLLNGEVGGNFPASVTFHEYDQVMEDGSVETIQQRIYDIILTCVHNYGGIPIEKIFINDIDLQIKQIVRYTGNGELYYCAKNGRYTLDSDAIKEDAEEWKTFYHNEDVGYVYTDFTYPGELVTGLGENVCTVLNKIISTLGNYEYFFDIEGNFIFQEIKNYLNHSYNPATPYRLDNRDKTYTVQYQDPNTQEGEEPVIITETRKVEVKSNELTIVDNTNYAMDIRSNSKVAYSFTGGNGLINSYANNPQYSNIKNDFHVWGENENGGVIHYHLAIKDKPKEMHNYFVIFELDEDNKPTGRIKRLATAAELENAGVTPYLSEGTLYLDPYKAESAGEILIFDGDYAYVEGETLKFNGEKSAVYTPEDWRAELYLQGMTKKLMQIRPDEYEQELLDLFDSIYNFYEKKFKADIVQRPNDLKYFFDYLEPIDNLYAYSVDAIGTRIKTYQQDKIRKLYNTDVPNLIMIDKSKDYESERKPIIERCSFEGQPYSNVEPGVAKNTAIGTYGYTAQETMRELLYQYTNYNESISLQCVPLYHLDVNRRITVQDRSSNIYGDYIVKTINLPLGGSGLMNISATRALDRI